MKRSFRSRYLIRKNRLKNHSAHICRDCLKAVGLLGAIFFLTAGWIYAYNWAISSSYFRIKSTQVRGCRELTEKEVLALAALKPSQTIFSVNIKGMARRIATQPWVKTVAVAREFPNRLVVEVRERSALALCKKDEGFLLVDEEGLLFKELDDGDDVDVPVLTGYYRDGHMNQQLFDKTMLLMKTLSAAQSFPTLQAVSEINGSEVSGLTVYTENGFCLKLGFGNYESKLQRLLPVITALNKKDMNRGLLNIDLRDTSKIYVEGRDVTQPLARPVRKKGLST